MKRFRASIVMHFHNRCQYPDFVSGWHFIRAGSPQFRKYLQHIVLWLIWVTVTEFFFHSISSTIFLLHQTKLNFEKYLNTMKRSRIAKTFFFCQKSFFLPLNVYIVIILWNYNNSLKSLNYHKYRERRILSAAEIHELLSLLLLSPP